MRAFLLVVLAAALAVPAVAIAERGSDGASRISTRLGRFPDDEREVKGRIVSLAPLRVGRLTCVVRSRASVSAFQVGDFVEVTCDRIRGQWVLRRLKHEDGDDGDNRVGRTGNSGPGSGGGGQDDNSGSGSGDDDDDDNSDSGSGSGSSGPG